MAFVLETLNEEQRAKYGFATEADYEALQKKGRFIFPIKKWAVDQERDVAIVCSIGNHAYAQIELYWGKHTILATGSAPTQQRRPQGEETGDRNRVDVFFEIRELMVPEVLRDKMKEIQQLITEGLEVYCWGIQELNGKGYTKFLPTMRILFVEEPKSAFKMSSYTQYLT